MDLTSIIQLAAQPLANEINTKITNETEKAIALGFLNGLSQFFGLIASDVAALEVAATPAVPAA